MAKKTSYARKITAGLAKAVLPAPLDPIADRLLNTEAPVQQIPNQFTPMTPSVAKPQEDKKKSGGGGSTGTRVYTDSETGETTGFEFKGKTYFGKPNDINPAVNELERRRLSMLPTATATTPEKIQQQRAVESAVSQIGNVNPNALPAVQETSIDYGQAATAGLANVIPNALAGAATGAGIGLLGGPAAPITSTAGAIIGGSGAALATIWRGVAANIKKQQSGNISKEKDVLSYAKANMRTLATLAGKDPANAAEYVAAYNNQLAQVYQAQRKIRLETQGNLNSFMEDGTDILSDFDLFLSPSGTADIYGQKLKLALQGGVPLDFTEEDLTASLEQ